MKIGSHPPSNVKTELPNSMHNMLCEPLTIRSQIPDCQTCLAAYLHRDGEKREISWEEPEICGVRRSKTKLSPQYRNFKYTHTIAKGWKVTW